MDKNLLESIVDKQSNYVAPFLWLHNEDDNLILSEIKNIYNCGVRAICLESRTHEEFCRDDWWEDVRLILDECSKLNMNVWILDDKHFPSGYANGIFKEKFKHLQSFGITEQHVDVSGPINDGSVMASCWLTQSDDEIIQVSALKHIPNSEKYCDIIDITNGLNGDMLYFDLPEGNWRIVFVIKTKSGKANHLQAYCDMLNPSSIDLLIDEIYESHYSNIQKYFGNTFLGFFSDEPSFLNNTINKLSPDLGIPFTHYPWNDRLKSLLKIELLPCLWYEIDDLSHKFRYSYMNIITTEYQRNYSDKLGNWCRNHNVSFIGHVIEDNNIHAKTGHGAGHYFRALNGQDMSGIDVVLHQIVPGLTEVSNAGLVSYKHMANDFYHYYLGKLASSFAHIDPIKKGRAMCEIFGAYGWAEGTKTMKYLMDHMLVRGINYFVPHAFSPKPNDTDCPPNFYDSGNNPQFKFFKRNMDYLNRMCHMLNDGKHISCCAILYDAEIRWTNTDYLPLEKIAKKLYDNLLDYDIIPTDYLDKISNGSLNGEKYNCLIVPYAKNYPNELICKLKNADINVIIVSETEQKTKFKNVTLNSLPSYMHQNGYSDVTSDYNGIYLRYYHYERSSTHIYMFSNEDVHNTINTKIKLIGLNNGTYIEYDVFENKATYKTFNNEISLTLPPYNSRLLIFNDEYSDIIPQSPATNVKSEIVLNLKFNISIAKQNSTHFIPYKNQSDLFNITGRNGLPEFSGHVKYETELSVDSKNVLLDLGFVGEVAELYINDKFVGEKLFPPYIFDLSKFVKKGINKMTLIVSNHNGYAKRDNFSKYLLFEPSGLIGPLKLLTF